MFCSWLSRGIIVVLINKELEGQNVHEYTKVNNTDTQRLVNKGFDAGEVNKV